MFVCSGLAYPSSSMANTSTSQLTPSGSGNLPWAREVAGVAQLSHFSRNKFSRKMLSPSVSKPVANKRSHATTLANRVIGTPVLRIDLSH